MGDIGPNEHEVEFLPLDEPETESAPVADPVPEVIPEKVPGKVAT